MLLCEGRACTGCMACVNACPIDAIQMKADEEGFARPVVDDSRCVQCGKCQRACPQLVPGKRPEEEKQVYACWVKDPGLRKKSTSGGAFSALAKHILAQGGCVFGAGFDENLNVVHKQVRSQRGLAQLRGSKYVQSYVGLTFREVKQCLLEGKKVLYSGTACQIDGLYAYLGERYEGQLFTVDLVCHGVPSPKVYRDYLEYMQQQFGAPVKQVFFRNKEPGWYVFGMKLVFKNGKTYKASTYDDPYIRGFLRELFLRSSCHQCAYAGTDRVADITLADFWGYWNTCRADRDHDKGVSMVMVNSENGKALFAGIQEPMRVWERPLAQAVNGNRALRKCFPPSEKREQFWEDYGNMPFSQIVEKYLYPEPKETQFHPNLKSRYRQQDLYALKILPNRIILKLLGEQRYEKIKNIIRRG